MGKIFFKSLFTFLIIFLGFAFFNVPLPIFAAANHIVISQVQIGASAGSGGAGNEFVELYNPTNNPVNLTGWRLREENSSGSSFANLISSMSGTIAAHGYYLVGSPSYSGSAVIDAPYSASSSAIPANGTILLYSDNSVTLIDKVGMGTAGDFETSAAPEPVNDGSVQRKVDDSGGHGLDSNNNSSDFEALTISTPRNSSTLFTTPTASPTSTPTDTPLPTETPVETISPTPTSSPTVTPSATPEETSTSTPSPTPTTNPTNTPVVTVIPSSTPTASPSPEPSHKPKDGKIIEIFHFHNKKIVCRVYYKFVHKRWFFGYYPEIVCSRD